MLLLPLELELEGFVLLRGVVVTVVGSFSVAVRFQGLELWSVTERSNAECMEWSEWMVECKWLDSENSK